VRLLLSDVIVELPTAEGTWEVVNKQTDSNNLLREAAVLVSIVATGVYAMWMGMGAVL